MRLVIPTEPWESRQFADWLAEQHGETAWRGSGPFFGYGLKDGQDIRAAVVLEPFHAPGSLLASMSLGSPDVVAHRKLIKQALAVPFEKPFDAKRVSAIIECRYTRVIRVAEILGFEVEGTLACHFGGNDGVLMGMTKNPLGLAG